MVRSEILNRFDSARDRLLQLQQQRALVAALWRAVKRFDGIVDGAVVFTSSDNPYRVAYNHAMVKLQYMTTIKGDN